MFSSVGAAPAGLELSNTPGTADGDLGPLRLHAGSLLGALQELQVLPMLSGSICDDIIGGYGSPFFFLPPMGIVGDEAEVDQGLHAFGVSLLPSGHSTCSADDAPAAYPNLWSLSALPGILDFTPYSISSLSILSPEVYPDSRIGTDRMIF